MNNIVSVTNVIRSDILFVPKLPKAITLDESQISLRSNKTRQRRIKLPNVPMGSWALNAFSF